jgi:hypothetical protein
MSDSNLGRNRLSWLIFLFPHSSRKIPECYLKLGQDRSLLHPFQFMTRNDPAIQSYIVWAHDCVLKWRINKKNRSCIRVSALKLHRNLQLENCVSEFPRQRKHCNPKPRECRLSVIYHGSQNCWRWERTVGHLFTISVKCDVIYVLRKIWRSNGNLLVPCGKWETKYVIFFGQNGWSEAQNGRSCLREIYLFGRCPLPGYEKCTTFRKLSLASGRSNSNYRCSAELIIHGYSYH